MRRDFHPSDHVGRLLDDFQQPEPLRANGRQIQATLAQLGWCLDCAELITIVAPHFVRDRSQADQLARGQMIVRR